MTFSAYGADYGTENVAIDDAWQAFEPSAPPAGKPPVEAAPASGEPAHDLVEAFWPGGLTIVLPALSSLSWDLGDTRGTVAVRMPAHRIALELLEETGPLAVSSANLTGRAAGITAEDSEGMLGDSVAVYLSDGPSTTGISSTIIDATSLVGQAEPLVRVLREGAVSREQLRSVLGDLLEPDPEPDGGPGPGPGPDQPDGP